MGINFTNVVFTVLSLIILAVPGFILVKTKMLGEKSAETLSNIVLYVCQPALVFVGFQGKEYSAEMGVNMLIVAGLALCMHLLMTAIMFICVRDKDNSAKIKCLRFACIFGNCGFMGFPMIQSLFSGTPVLGEAIVYCAVVVAVFNILSWTLGVYILTKDVKNISVKKILLNPTIIAVVVGFLVYLIAKVPLVDLVAQGSTGDVVIEKMMSSVDLLAETVTPMAMMVIGMKLAKANFRQIFLDKYAYICTFFKLFISSVVAMLLVTFLPISQTIKYVIFFLFSVPSATSTALFAVRFNSDADSASVMVLMTSILSMVTIPIMYLIYTGIFSGII